MKKILTITLLIMTTFLYGQDTIRTTSTKEIIAKVVEVNKDDIRYKKYSNINGPTYSLSKNEIISITYLNGETEIFVNSKKEGNSVSELDDFDQFKKLTKKNNTVYIDSEDRGAITHATNVIAVWGYWIITKNKKEADFILKFHIRYGGMGNTFGTAQFIDPQTNKTLKITKEIKNTIFSEGFNNKRGVINNIVKKEIKPMF
jgi:hypothetical protein